MVQATWKGLANGYTGISQSPPSSVFPLFSFTSQGDIIHTYTDTSLIKMLQRQSKTFAPTGR